MPDDDASPSPSGGGGNFLTRKLGPLPTWGWIAAVGVGLAVFLYRRKQQAAAAASSTTSTGTQATSNAPDVFGASGYSGGQNVGGYDYAPTDAYLQQLQSQMATIQAQTAPNQGAPIQAASGGTVAPVQGTNTLESLISAQYQQQLGRAPDPQGLQYWEQYYQQQGPAQEAAAFAASTKNETGKK